MGLIRFLRGAKLLGQTKAIPGKSLVEHAYAAKRTFLQIVLAETAVRVW